MLLAATTRGAAGAGVPPSPMSSVRALLMLQPTDQAQAKFQTSLLEFWGTDWGALVPLYRGWVMQNPFLPRAQGSRGAQPCPPALGNFTHEHSRSVPSIGGIPHEIPPWTLLQPDVAGVLHPPGFMGWLSCAPGWLQHPREIWSCPY